MTKQKMKLTTNDSSEQYAALSNAGPTARYRLQALACSLHKSNVVCALESLFARQRSLRHKDLQHRQQQNSEAGEEQRRYTHPGQDHKEGGSLHTGSLGLISPLTGRDRRPTV